MPLTISVREPVAQPPIKEFQVVFSRHEAEQLCRAYPTTGSIWQVARDVLGPVLDIMRRELGK